ncbi:MAG: dihydroorotate dehydrogenase electron transfer subunit [Planctomycetes bacterium]|nr:dihydroorotate dehydrogenase electron transfer subunit [Planctomycetota bacterium]
MSRITTSQECEANPLQAARYADSACQLRVPITENVQLAQGTYRVRLECPEIARRIVPGQFLMLRLADVNDPLLGRPLAIFDTVLDSSGSSTAVDIVYLAIGKMTRRLANCAVGEEIDVWGPLGNGFPPEPTAYLIMVAGGIGQTPFLTLGQEFLGRRRYGEPHRNVPPSQRVTLCYGVRTADFLAGVHDFEAAGVDVRLSSDDGSVGHHGLVTDLLEQVLDESRGTDRRVVCCGPEPMMAAVADRCKRNQVPCQVSLETPMACGIGICFSCVTKVRQADGSWDYKRTCVEGPVFDAEKIVW